MSEETTIIEMAGRDGETLSTGNLDEAKFIIERCMSVLRRESAMRSASGYSIEKARNEALYKLTGEVSENLASPDTNNETLPWLERATDLEKVEDLYESMTMVIEYYKANADIFKVYGDDT